MLFYVLCLGLASGLFPSDFSYRTPYIHIYMYLLNNTYHMTHPSHPPWFDHPNNNCEVHKTWSSSLCNYLHSPFISYLLCPNIFLITLASNTLNLCSTLNVSDQASYPYKTTGKILVPHRYNISNALKMLWKKMMWLEMCMQIKC
jgi:hypothetical protein